MHGMSATVRTSWSVSVPLGWIVLHAKRLPDHRIVGAREGAVGKNRCGGILWAAHSENLATLFRVSRRRLRGIAHMVGGATLVALLCRMRRIRRQFWLRLVRITRP